MVAVVVGLVLSGQALALRERPVSVSDFQRTTFTAKDGAPERIWAIAQTNDGWLWFGGSMGLTRFDGVDFETVDVSTTDGRLSAGVSMLYALSSGGLVIGHLSGGVTILQGGAFKRFDSDDVHASGRPFDFVADQDGVIWGTFEKGVMRFDGTTWARIGPDWNLPSAEPQEVLFDAAGTLWIHTRNNISRLKHGEKSFEVVGQIDEPGAFVQSHDGDLLFVNVIGGKTPTRRWKSGGRDPGDSSRRSASAYIDGEGNLWSRFVDLRQDSEVAKFAVAGLDEFGAVSMFFEDAEKNVWIAQTGMLHRLRRSPVARVIDARQSAGGKADMGWTNVVADGNGTIWYTHWSSASFLAGSPTGGLWSVKDGMRPVKEEAVGPVIQVAADPTGSVWAAGTTGLWELHATTITRRAEFSGAESGPPAVGLAAGCSGGVWAAVQGGDLRRFSEGAWAVRGGSHRLPSATPTSLHCDKARNLWVGYGDGRIVRVDPAFNATFLHFVGPGIGAISSINVGRHTLVGGSRGLAILGNAGLTRIASRLPVLEGITGIVESRDGHVWLTGARGLVRLWSSDLDPAAESERSVRTELFDADDGFPAPTYSLAGWTTPIAIDADERVWFAGLGGLAMIDAARIPPAAHTPQIVLKALVAGGRTIEPASALSLAEGTRSVEIAYTALHAIHPERLRFRYRLDGVDDDWVNVEERRRAIYTNLPPGKHRFQLDVTDEFGSWANHPTTMTFEIPPTFLQSQTFKLLCLATVLGLLVTAYRLRMRYHERRHQQLMIERLDERERIARELHDTLLAGTQALILKVHSATQLTPKDEPIHQALDKALDQATNVMVEARNRIEDLRVQDAPDEDLVTLLVHFGQELVKGEDIVFKAFVEGSARDLEPDVLREAGLIGREALLNAFHHARPTTIELQITFTADDLQLRVRDDGLGFDEKVLAQPTGGRHWGLPGMQERARAIASTMSIWSRPGLGTEIELRIPAKVAYAQGPVQRRWSGFHNVFGYRS